MVLEGSGVEMGLNLWRSI